jgi:transcriptional regulator with XRE-family HTH domain
MQYCTISSGRASAGKEQAVSYKKLGKRIQHAREEAGLSQEQLAAMLGCSQPTLSNYEKGKSRIYLTQLQKVSEILNRPAQFFLEAMEPTEEERIKPYSIEFSRPYQEDGTVQMDKDISDIVKVLYELPPEARRIVYEFAQWEYHKTRRYRDNG